MFNVLLTELSPFRYVSVAIASHRGSPASTPVICKLTSIQAKIKANSIRRQIPSVLHKLETDDFFPLLDFMDPLRMAYRGAGEDHLVSVWL